MVKGKRIDNDRASLQKPVVEYRKIDALNQSMLKLFDSDPFKFFEQFKMGKTKRDKPSTAQILGSIVDFHVLECKGDEEEFDNRFDEKFALFDGKKGGAQVFILADELFEITEEYTNLDGEVTISFEERFKEAFRKVQGMEKYKGKTIEKAIDDFNENGREYFDKLIDSVGKTVVDIFLLEKGKYVSNILLTDPFTRELFQEDDGIEVLTHLPIEFKYLLPGNKFIKCKAEIDRLEINHNHKTIRIDDLKTNYDNESFDYAYIKNSYYIQGAFYFKAVQSWMEQEQLTDYHLNPMRFIVGDTSINNRRPLIYHMTMEDVNSGLYGFKYRGNNYRGVSQLVNAIAWAEENNVWNCSKEAYEANGLVGLNINYEPGSN
jgi:hypothetical protein